MTFGRFLLQSYTTTKPNHPAPVPLPAPWVGNDIGAPALTGSSTYDTGVFTILGGGVDIWGTDDQSHFVHQSLTGDGSITARVKTQTNTADWVKSGVMIKSSTTAGSPYALLAMTSAFGTTLQANFNESTVVAGNALPNAWLRLIRNGTTVTGQTSPNGTTWTTVTSTTVSLGSTAEVGIFVCSHNAGSLCTSTFDNVAVSNVVTPPLPPTITSLSPMSGAAGATVTITGTNFVSGATVSFGGTAGTGVTVVSSTQITCTAPSHANGAVSVTVTTSAGTSSAATFTYATAGTVSVTDDGTGLFTIGTSGSTSFTDDGTGLFNIVASGSATLTDDGTGLYAIT